MRMMFTFFKVLEARKVDISQDKIRYPMAPHPERKNEFSGAKLSLPLPDGSGELLHEIVQVGK